LDLRAKDKTGIKRPLKTRNRIFQGRLESFLVSPDNLYGIIGDEVEGEVGPGAYAHIQLNSMVNFAARIDEVKEIQLSGERGTHQLILFNQQDEGMAAFLHAMNVGTEVIEIRKSGED
jgi:hypothetical protein